MTDTVPFAALRGIVKRFRGVVANDHVDIEVMPGEILAILGENGAGKSTAMQILYGLYRADAGDILVRGRKAAITGPADAIALGIGMVHQEFMLVGPMSVVENVVLGLGRRTGARLDLNGAARRLRAIAELHGLVVDPWAIVAHLPIGVQQRVEILKLLYRDAQLLILDEPTAVLTPQEKDGLFATLRSLRAEGRSIVIVTHKLHEIMALADRVTVMRGGRTVGTVAVAQTSEADLARRMVGRDVVLRVIRPPAHPGAAVLSVSGLAVRDAAGREVLHGIDLIVRAGEILGIAGVDGNGQSELADALLGLLPAQRGRIAVDGADLTRFDTATRRAHGMGLVPADRRGTGALAALPITDNAVLGEHRRHACAGGMLLDRRAMADQARRIVARFGVHAPSIGLEAGKLSGGNLQRLILGREVLRGPKLLVAEQPTRGLDVSAVEAVWQALLDERSRGRAILLISAELEEILNLADRIAVMFEGRIAGVFESADASMQSLGLMMAGASMPAAA